MFFALGGLPWRQSSPTAVYEIQARYYFLKFALVVCSELKYTTNDQFPHSLV